ncbi:MAG: sulfatase-like hydrolase/transferase, partial [Proteobacteria bacterium]|nr:sulfatase-like hydrolase/transferase [Pseudomonadota bacterium]
MNLSRNFLYHLSFWFVTLFATPLFIAVNNSEDIVLPMLILAGILLSASLVLTLATAGIAHLLGSSVAQRTALLFLGLALVLAIQCNVVHDLFFYGNFNGEKVDFRSDANIFWYEWYAFLAVTVAVTGLLQWFRPRSRWLAALPILSSSLLLVPALIEYSGDVEPVAQGLNIDPSVFNFSRNGNVIHLLPDGFQSDIAQQVLEENPDLAAEFEGFTFFANHLGMFQGTAPSIPTILTGKPFELDQGHDYQKVISHIQADGYPSVLKNAGYQLDYVLISKAYCSRDADSCLQRPFNDMKSRGYYRHRSESHLYSLRILADLTLFRLFPRLVKERIYDHGQWYFADTTLDGSSPWPDPVIREWTAKMRVTDGPPVYKWYHYVGTHMPPYWDAKCTRHKDLERSRENYLGQSYCVLKGIAGLIAKLKEQGIYDETVIVISGDHGCGIPPADNLSRSQQSALPLRMVGSARPAFLIKEKHNNQPLAYSQVPTSLVDIAPTVLALAGFKSEVAQASAFDYTDQSRRTRYFKPYTIREFFNKKPVPHVVYKVDGDVRDSSSWLVEQINVYRTAPSQYDPVNFTTGYNFVVGTRFSRSKPDNDATWINGRQLAFLISLPEDSLGSPVLKFALHLPEWIPEQRMQV